MHFVDVLLLLLVLAVSTWIARSSSHAARVVLFGSAVVVSAALFLPSSMLRATIGPEALASIEVAFDSISWTLANVAHFTAFLWLALVVWTLRPDLRGWRSVAALGILAVASELAQRLTSERSPHLNDAGVNLMGAGMGLLLAAIGSAFGRMMRPRPPGPAAPSSPP